MSVSKSGHYTIFPIYIFVWVTC